MHDEKLSQCSERGNKLEKNAEQIQKNAFIRTVTHLKVDRSHDRVVHFVPSPRLRGRSSIASVVVGACFDVPTPRNNERVGVSA